MSSARKGNYAPRRETDSFEELSAKLTADLRSHVRFMVRGLLRRRRSVWIELN